MAIWTFEWIPYFHQGYKIGGVLHAIPPIKAKNKLKIRPNTPLQV